MRLIAGHGFTAANVIAAGPVTIDVIVLVGALVGGGELPAGPAAELSRE